MVIGFLPVERLRWRRELIRRRQLEPDAFPKWEPHEREADDADDLQAE